MAYPPATLGGSGWTVPPISGGVVQVSSDGEALVDGVGNLYPVDGSIAAQITSMPAVQSAGVKILTAVIRNSLSDQARTNEPAEIRINIPDGWAPTANCIRVRDDSGAYVAWQWEPCRHERTDADISKHASTNIKAGSVWVMVPSIAAGSSVTYTVEIWPTAQTQSFTAAIAASDPDGSTHRWTASGFVIDFTAGFSWGLTSWVNAAGYDMFLGANCGVEMGFRLGATTEYAGATVAAKAQTSVSHAEDSIDSAAFGYGNVFRKWVAVSTGATLTSTQHTAIYKGFANGRVELRVAHLATAAMSSANPIWWQSAIKPREGTGNHTGSVPGMWIECEWSGVHRLSVACRSAKWGSDAITDAVSTGTVGKWPGGTSYVLTGTTPRLRTGSQSTTYAIPQYTEVREYWTMEQTTGLAADARLRCWNPLITTAARSDNMRKQLVRFAAEMQTYALKYTAWSSADTNYALQPNVVGSWVTSSKVGGGDQWSLAASRLQAWVTGYGVGPVDSGMGARLFAVYKVPPDIGGGNYLPTGMEYIGRHGSAIYLIWQEAVRRNDAAVQTLAAGMLRGLADCCTLAEADIGSTGRVNLNYYDLPAAASPNATAEAALCIAQAALTGYRPTGYDTVLRRMWTQLAGVMEFRNRYPYRYLNGDELSGAVQFQAPAYYSRVAWAVRRIGEVLPDLIPSYDPVYAFTADSNAVGQVEEWRENFYYFKRGFASTNLQFAVMLAWMARDVCDVEQAISVLKYVNDTAGSAPYAWPLDGWLSPVTPVVGYSLGSMMMNLPVERVTAGS